MLTVACVNYGDYLGRGADYVARMLSMVKRNLSEPFRFECLTDEGDLGGWWAKIELFRPGRFSGRVVYFDLDTVIVGDLAPLVAAPGIIHLDEWGWPAATLCSSVMVWDAGEHEQIWEKFSDEIPREYRGDQDYITELGGWERLPAHLCRSYRYHCVNKPPPGCVNVSMHGRPKPHEIASGWVPEAWQ